MNKKAIAFAAGVLLSTASIAAPSGYQLVSESPDGLRRAYVNVDTIKRQTIVDILGRNQVELVVFDNEQETKERANDKMPDSIRRKNAVNCDTGVLFELSPSGDGMHLYYRNPEIVVSGTMGESIQDFVCSIAVKQNSVAPAPGK